MQQARRAVLGAAFVLIVFSLVFPTFAFAQADANTALGNNAKLKFSGVGWITYRYRALYEPTRPDVSGMRGTYLKKDTNSFDIDRVYLTADYAFDEQASAQTQFEATNLSGNPDFRLKKAFFKLRDPLGLRNTSVRVGQFSHVMSPVVEEAWGYRIVSKEPLDRYLGVKTVYVGAGTDGKLLNDAFAYDLAVTNHSGYDRADTLKYKTGMGRITVRPAAKNAVFGGLKLSGWGQYAGRPNAADNHDLWMGGLAGYTYKTFSGGLLFSEHHSTTNTFTNKARAMSAFGSVAIAPADRIFVRGDFFDPNLHNSGWDAQYTAIGGVSHVYRKGIRGIMDFEYTYFQQGPNQDFDPDLTLSARLEATF